MASRRDQNHGPECPELLRKARVRVTLTAMTPPLPPPTPPATPTPAIAVRDLRVSFGRAPAVDGVDLSVPAGAAVGLLGRNGAGKSTTLRVLAGALPPTAGHVEVWGVDVGADPFGARAVVGYCPDVGGLIPRATPWEHLELAARLRRLPAGWEHRARDLLERFDLGADADRVTAGFSHGMGRRLSVVLAALHAPRVLLLDEPFDGVDPVGVEATLDLISELRVGGTAVLVSSHLLPLVVRATTQAVVLRAGRIVGAAPSAELDGETGAERYRGLLGGVRG
ncbi:ABC transporter ATP-binding protein [Sporichthya brevicatena]|uniref:ABC transporter ATP-binding protein n=2 Tax=Sporichthya brevicatena TaxID=171442 RepID=A0ABN1GT69_9ACTN